MAKRTNHQEVCIRTENGLKFELPKNINSDIGYQLMFGAVEDYDYEKTKERKHNETYETKQYNESEIIWFI